MLLSQLSLKDVATITGLSFGFPLARYVLDSLVLKPLSRQLLAPQWAVEKALPGKLEVKLEKLCESLWKLAVYTTFFVWGFSNVGTSWISTGNYPWFAFSMDNYTSSEKSFCLAELSFYIAGLFFLLVWETRRKDFEVMFAHHCVSITLIYLSFEYNFMRTACVVLVLHDLCDVLMEAAKSCKYCKQEAAATALFGLFTLAWAVLRLGLFARVGYASLMDMPNFVPSTSWVYQTCIGMFITLYCMNLYWFTLIMQVVYRQLCTGTVSDIREDDDD